MYFTMRNKQTGSLRRYDIYAVRMEWGLVVMLPLSSRIRTIPTLFLLNRVPMTCMNKCTRQHLMRAALRSAQWQSRQGCLACIRGHFG